VVEAGEVVGRKAPGHDGIVADIIDQVNDTMVAKCREEAGDTVR
jgi:hypothetical protein